MATPSTSPTPLRPAVPVAPPEPSDNEVRWLAMVLRRVGILLVKEIERRYGLPSSFR